MTAPNYFLPSQKTIRAIGGVARTFIVTTQPHGYFNGLVVRIVIPFTAPPSPLVPLSPNNAPRGMSQLDGFVGPITVLSPTAFSLAVASSSFDPYRAVVNPQDEAFLGQVIPIAESTLTLNSATANSGNILPETVGTISIIAQPNQ